MSKLVHISEAASIAIHSLALIASSSKKLNVKQISALLQVSHNHLAKVLQVLAKNDYLTSNRGPDGGFIMKKSPDEINMLEIYELIEGTIDCQFCGITTDSCPFITCIFGDKPDKLTNEFTDYMRITKISELKTKEIQHA